MKPWLTRQRAWIDLTVTHWTESARHWPLLYLPLLLPLLLACLGLLLYAWCLNGMEFIHDTLTQLYRRA